MQERAVKIIKLNATPQLHLPDISFSKIQTCLMVKKYLDNNICSNFDGHFGAIEFNKLYRVTSGSLKVICCFCKEH